MFSCEFCDIFKNSFFKKHLWTAACTWSNNRPKKVSQLTYLSPYSHGVWVRIFFTDGFLMISEGIELIRLNSLHIRDQFGDDLLETFMTFFETIYYHLYNLKNTPPWVFLTFFQLYKWYKITQIIKCFQLTSFWCSSICAYVDRILFASFSFKFILSRRFSRILNRWRKTNHSLDQFFQQRRFPS